MSVMMWSPDLKKKKSKLSWIVKFLQMDLNSLSEGEKKRLMLSPMFMPLFVGYMMKILGSRDKEGKHLLPREGLKRLQDGMNEFFHQLLTQKDSGGIIRLPSKDRELTVSDAGTYEIGYPIHTSTRTIADVSIFISEFADLLNGLPKDWIRKCPGCGKFFVHISRKVKIYCSNRCAYIAIHRRRIERLKDEGRYENYLKTQRKKMKAHYREESNKKER